MRPARSPTRPQQPLRVAVASDQTLVAQAVVAALRSHSFEPLLVRWPQLAPEQAAKGPRRGGRRGSSRQPPDVGLLVSDLARMPQVRAALLLVTSLPMPWLVMAGVGRGPAWGALYDAGATVVVPRETGLAEVCTLLEELPTGSKPAGASRERRELIRGWRTFAARRSDLAARVQSLTDREEEILRHLHQGLAVQGIAERSMVTESTVRSQVKAILRKLDVNSQMAAVAAYEDLLADSTAGDGGRR